MDKLIFDRTSSDVEYAKNNPSAQEWLKGCYNYIDLNRVEEWCKYLSDLLNSYGYVNLISEKTDWNIKDIQTVEEMKRYLNNIKVLMNAFTVKPNTPKLPDTINKLNYIQANNIEKILYDIDELLRAMSKTFVYSGVAGTGQNRIWQQRFRRYSKSLRQWLELTQVYWSNFSETETWEDIIYD